ncbi:MAG: DUF3365 domain-containing protein [Deltaproteobacteria bacterium]|nr:DUF3365 domain-containing protein [Deltaproteobacteria bacterium]
MKNFRLTAGKTLLILPFFLLTFIILVFVIYHECNGLAIKEAEKNLAGFLLNHRAIHYFVEEVQKPEIYLLKENNRLYPEYFSPKLLSFTYIARNIKDALNSERQKMGLDQVYFKLASKNPRNSVNLADSKELALLQAFNDGTLKEYKGVVSTTKDKYLYYAIPISPNKQSCMHCHDDPAVAPREMVDQYGAKAGFHEKIGDIRALISVRVPLEGLVAEANRTTFILSSATFVLLSGVFFVVSFFLGKIDNQKQRAEENAYYLNSVLQSSTNTAIIATDRDYKVKYFNHVAEQLFGIPASSACQATIQDISKDIDQDIFVFFHKSSELLHGLKSYQVVLDYKGKIIEANISATLDNDQQCAGFLLLGQDITSRVHEEQELIKTKQRLQEFRQTVDLALDCVFMFEPETFKFTYVNQGAVAQLGLSQEELLEMAPFDIKPEFSKERFLDMVAPLVAKKIPVLTFETVHKHKNGSLIPVEIFLQHINTTDRKGIFVAFARDISRQKEVEKCLREYGETQQILLREINHRVKNNLSAIIGMLNMEIEAAVARGELEHIDTVKELESRIRGLSTVHSFLTSSKWQPLRLDHLCTEIVKGVVLGRSWVNKVDFKVAHSSIVVSSEQAHNLSLVINELTTNAIKHALPGTETIRLSLSFELKDGMIIICFRDNGPGYPDALLSGDWSKANIGFEIIRGVVSTSLQGELSLSNDNGAVACVSMSSAAQLAV